MTTLGIKLMGNIWQKTEYGGNCYNYGQLLQQDCYNFQNAILLREKVKNYCNRKIWKLKCAHLNHLH